jgi:stearoyl-CoA desaturase (delta-9 desaturase)
MPPAEATSTPEAQSAASPAEPVVEQTAAANVAVDRGEDRSIGVDPQRLPPPEKTQPFRILWEYVAVLGILHAIALLAFVPWLFTWSGVVLAVLGHFVFGMFGITIGYHRLLTHRGFSCPKWLEHGLAILGMCNLQDSPARWVAIHRMHHQHSDKQPDPHSPLVSFLWGHMGWVVVRNRDLDRTSHYERYVRDLLRDPFYLALERRGSWFFVFLLHAAVITLLGAVVGYSVGGGSEAIRYAASYYVWAVAVRIVFVLHGTWAVNSLSHAFGYRNYETRDSSTNNWLVAMLTHGEGWHNNHHAEPRAAAHGHRWWEFDMSWRVIQLMERIGLAKDVVRPKAMTRK